MALDFAGVAVHKAETFYTSSHTSTSFHLGQKTCQMELWASGFNAWNQLRFGGELEAEPRDLQDFKCMLKDERIEVLRTFLSATLVRISSGLRIAGAPDEFTQLYSYREDDLHTVAVAGNDKLADTTPSGITQYDSLHKYLEKDGYTFEDIQDIKQIVANQTGFTALSTSGTVYTWGDGRYEACLGRDITDESPASNPSIVEELSELPDKVIKISSGGYASAALTSGNDIYIWGRQGHPELSEPLTGSPTPLDLEGLDFLDVAVGMNHIVLLTTERKVFVVGACGNGQLGLGSDIRELKDWTEVQLLLKENQRVASVYAGYKNSFLIVEDVM